MADLLSCLSKWNNVSAVDRIQTPLAPTDTNFTDAGCALSDLCGARSCTFFLRGVTVHVACANGCNCSLFLLVVSGDNDSSSTEKICPYPDDLERGLLLIFHRLVTHSMAAEREPTPRNDFLGRAASALGGQVWRHSGGSRRRLTNSI